MVSTTPLASVCRCSHATCFTSTLGRACTPELATRLMNSSFVTLVSARRPRTAQKFVSSCRGQYLGAMPVRDRQACPLRPARTGSMDVMCSFSPECRVWTFNNVAEEECKRNRQQPSFHISLNPFFV